MNLKEVTAVYILKSSDEKKNLASENTLKKTYNFLDFGPISVIELLAKSSSCKLTEKKSQQWFPVNCRFGIIQH